MPSYRRPNRRQFLESAAAASAALVPLCRAAAVDPATAQSGSLPAGILEVVGADPQRGAARAVVVGDVPLVHTEQVFAEQVLSDAAVQAAEVLAGLDQRLQRAGSSLGETVKLNWYVADQQHVAAVEAAMARIFRGPAFPAVAIVVGELAGEHRLVAADCIAVRREPVATGVVLRVEGAAVLPPMNKLYISGDAAPGMLMPCVEQTLDSLERTLRFCGLDWSHVVQLKSFLEPIALAADVRREMATVLGDRPLPVTTFVEWKSSPKVPIEIEAIVAVPPEFANKSGESVEYLTPAGMTASPVFSRAARVRSPRTIYVSGLYAEADGAAEQVHVLLQTLRETVEPLGSDLKHLAKATYYVVDDETSKALGKIRPEYYDPARPPAASKAAVLGTGRAAKTITLDMIAVPRS